eukprot:1618868-Rhodomonas_salina.1
MDLAMSAVESDAGSALRVAFYDWHNVTFPTRPSLGMPARGLGAVEDSKARHKYLKIPKFLWQRPSVLARL